MPFDAADVIAIFRTKVFNASNSLGLLDVHALVLDIAKVEQCS